MRHYNAAPEIVELQYSRWKYYHLVCLLFISRKHNEYWLKWEWLLNNIKNQELALIKSNGKVLRIFSPFFLETKKKKKKKWDGRTKVFLHCKILKSRMLLLCFPTCGLCHKREHIESSSINLQREFKAEFVILTELLDSVTKEQQSCTSVFNP